MNACQKCEYNSYFSGMERNGTVVKTPLNVIPEWKIFKSFNLVKILKIPKKKSETVNTIQSNDRQYNRSTDNTVERQTIQSNDRQYSRTTDNTIERQTIQSNDRQYNRRWKKDKSTNNDLQNNTQKAKNWSTRTPHKKSGDEQVSWKGKRSCYTIGMLSRMENFI